MSLGAFAMCLWVDEGAAKLERGARTTPSDFDARPASESARFGGHM